MKGTLKILTERDRDMDFPLPDLLLDIPQAISMKISSCLELEPDFEKLLEPEWNWVQNLTSYGTLEGCYFMSRLT